MLATLNKAVAWRQPPAGLLLHSDRGAPYGSPMYRDFIARHGFTGSMSGKSCCYDNAKVERFFGTPKDQRGAARR